MIDGSGRDSAVLVRGSHRSPGALEPRRFLEAVAGADQPAVGAGSGRLELAERLTAGSNPLFARVAANRVWFHLIGRGMVPTVDDFGVMGEPPDHPELLEHLATRFVESDYSLKGLIREIVSSSTYRQASTASARARELDPNNVLLSHAHVRRLSAEAIRDALLAVSGRLDRRLYGEPVPIHLTPFLDGRGRPGESGALDGEGRRSIYLAVRRNFLVPFFQVFDYPTPATTIGDRGASNVPAQALALLNDPFVVQQAERWARRTLAREGTDSERIERLYLEAFARAPEPDELAAALTFVQGADRNRDRDQAWADLCHVLFNVKELLFLR